MQGKKNAKKSKKKKEKNAIFIYLGLPQDLHIHIGEGKKISPPPGENFIPSNILNNATQCIFLQQKHRSICERVMRDFFEKKFRQVKKKHRKNDTQKKVWRKLAKWHDQLPGCTHLCFIMRQLKRKSDAKKEVSGFW